MAKSADLKAAAAEAILSSASLAELRSKEQELRARGFDEAADSVAAQIAEREKQVSDYEDAKAAEAAAAKAAALKKATDAFETANDAYRKLLEETFDLLVQYADATAPAGEAYAAANAAWQSLLVQHDGDTAHMPEPPVLPRIYGENGPHAEILKARGIRL